MSEKMWEVTYKHAKTCDMGSKLYMARGPNYLLILNPICQVVRAIIDGQIYPIRELTGIQKVKKKKNCDFVCTLREFDS